MPQIGRTPPPKRNRDDLAAIMHEGQVTAEMDAIFQAMAAAPPIGTQIQPILAFYLVSTIQFALRHPDFPPNVRVEMELMARQLQATLGKGNSLIAEMLDLGWDIQYDVPNRRKHP